MSDADHMAMSRIFELADTDPKQALAIIDDLSPPVLDLAELARFRALHAAALKPLVEAGMNVRSERDQLILATSGDTVELCEQAVRTISKIERGEIELYYVKADVFQRDTPEEEEDRRRADAVCIVLETLRPRRVQEIRGRTKISYFAPARLAFAPGFDWREHLSDENIARILNTLFEADAPVGTLVATEVVTKLDGSKMLNSRVFREILKSRPVRDPGPCLGLLSIGEDGSHFFEPSV